MGERYGGDGGGRLLFAVVDELVALVVQHVEQRRGDAARRHQLRHVEHHRRQLVQLLWHNIHPLRSVSPSRRRFITPGSTFFYFFFQNPIQLETLDSIIISCVIFVSFPRILTWEIKVELC